jgi:hypothetical protein
MTTRVSFLEMPTVIKSNQGYLPLAFQFRARPFLYAGGIAIAALATAILWTAWPSYNTAYEPVVVYRDYRGADQVSGSGAGLMGKRPAPVDARELAQVQAARVTCTEQVEYLRTSGDTRGDTMLAGAGCQPGVKAPEVVSIVR